MEANVQSLGVAGRVRVLAQPVERAARGLAGARFDLISPIPRMPTSRAARRVRALEALIVPLMSTGALLVLEHASRDPSPDIAGLVESDARTYGDTSLTFYAPSPQARS